MWNDIITLFIDDASIRLLVVRSQRIRKWAEIKLEPGLITDGIVTDEIEVANRIRQLVKTQKVRKNKIILGYSGLHSLTRPVTLPLLPKAMQSEAIVREARRVLPVQMDQLYLSWCSLPSQKNRIHVFLAATPRKTADSLVKTVKAAGLIVYRMALKPLALTKMLPENTAVLVDLQPTEFDIVIMVDGVAQPVRTVTFPNGNLSWAQKIELVANDLDRTIKFFDTNNPERPLDVAAQVYVSGDFISKPELPAALAKKIDRKVVPLTTNIKGAEQVDSGRYLANIAMAFDSPSSVRWSTFKSANINVLPAPYLPKPISFTKVIGIPASVVVATIAILLLITIQNTAANITSLQHTLDTTNQLYNQRLLQKQNLNKVVIALEKELVIINAENKIIQGSVDSIAIQQEIVTGDISAALARPDFYITLSNIRESSGNMTIEGTSSNENAVLTYARYLDQTGRFSSTTVTSFAVSEPQAEGEQTPTEIIGFTISLKRNEK